MFIRLCFLSFVVFVSPISNIALALPVINSVDGTVSHNNLLTIQGIGFSTKISAKPLLFWTADGGQAPSSLGRKTSWDGAFNGSFVTTQNPGAQIAPGSTTAVMLDHSLSSSAILGRVDFSSDQLYVWRKKYDDYEVATDYARRTRFTDLATPGASIPQGSWVVGNTSGATGIVQSFNITNPKGGNDTGEIFFESTGGTINDASSPLYFNGSYPKPENAETLTIYAAGDTTFTTPLYTMVCSEGYGLFKTFNTKVFRLWAEFGVYRNDMYMPMGPGIIGGARAYAENTGVSSYPVTSWPNPLPQLPDVWSIEEFIYQSSSIGVQDGIMLVSQNGNLGYTEKDRLFRNRTTEHPNKYAQLYQIQVSNGTQPGSISLYDSLYVDDTWHRVIVCSSSTWANCHDPEIQIPTIWNDTSITISLRLNHLAAKSSYLYVANAKGEVNEIGFPLCPLCPKPPNNITGG